MAAQRILGSGGDGGVIGKGDGAAADPQLTQQPADAEQHTALIVARDFDRAAANANRKTLGGSAAARDHDLRPRALRADRPVDLRALLDFLDEHSDGFFFTRRGERAGVNPGAA
jgi:hypothetical protein